jgi:hypothetical protein
MITIMIMIWRSLGEAFESLFLFHVEFCALGGMVFGIADGCLMVG